MLLQRPKAAHCCVPQAALLLTRRLLSSVQLSKGIVIDQKTSLNIAKAQVRLINCLRVACTKKCPPWHQVDNLCTSVSTARGNAEQLGLAQEDLALFPVRVLAMRTCSAALAAKAFSFATCQGGNFCRLHSDSSWGILALTPVHDLWQASGTALDDTGS